MNMGPDKPSGKDRLQGRKTLKVNDFLDEFEKDDIKKKVDIVDLFQSFGIELTKKGKSYSGKCLWHNDTNPSLSVDREKGLYNCFGCGESGDIFSLTEKMKGCGFKESLAYLKSFAAVPPKASTPHIEVNGAPSAPRAQDVDELTPRNEGSGVSAQTSITLSAIAEYYHKKLYENEKAIHYLHSRGLENIRNYERFQIGFADGTMLEKIGKDQRNTLVQLGVINSNGKEHFANCVTFPIVDDLGVVVGIYGRSIDPEAKISHLYLKGKHRGVFNRKASKVYDEIILTECIIDALSLIELGIENVKALYGTNGFTDEHLQTLINDRVKTVVLALDNDDPGREASERIKTKLLAEGFAVKVISPGLPLPPGEGRGEGTGPVQSKDWNEYLTGGGTAEEVKNAIANAEAAKAAEPTPLSADFSVTEEHSAYIFRIGDITYRVSNVKEMFVGSLRVQIKAELNHPPAGSLVSANETSSQKYYDTADLYSSRSRRGYAMNLSKEFNLEPRRIEKDLISILEYLENERDRKLSGGKEQAAEMTPQERELGLSLLRDPRLFERIVEDMEILGYVGEDLNKMLVYLAASSRKLDSPISVLILSGSAAGKSYIVDTVKELLPPEDVLALTSLSDQALNYAEDLDHKFLSLGEAVHSEPVEHQIREIISGRMISRLVTLKDPKTGKLKSELITAPAALSMVITGTKYDVNPENATRFFVVNIDETKEQTKRIHKRQRRKFSLESLQEKRRILPQIVKTHQAAQRLLRNIFVHIPYAEDIDFPDHLMRTRRDHDRFLDLIVCVAYLRQYQKEVNRDGDVEYLDADFEDYAIAREILVNGILASTMRELPRGSIDLYDELREIVRKLSCKKDLNPVDVGISQREIREHTGLGHSWVKMHLRILVEYEYLVVERAHGRGSRAVYRLREDAPISEITFAMIPTREELEGRVRDRENGKQQ